MALCQICAGLDLASIMLLKTPKEALFVEAYPESNNILHWLPGDDETQSPRPLLIPYHATVADLIRNAKMCNLCRVVHHSIASTVNLLEKITQSTPTASSILAHRVFLCGRQIYKGLQIMSRDENQARSTPVYLLGDVGFTENAVADPRSGSIWRIPESPRSTGTMEFIQMCLPLFAAYREVHHRPLEQPTRLLKYDQEIQKIVLCNAVPPDAKYAALSHCWGSVQPLTLNSQTAPQLRKGLPIKNFPQTFQDAFWLIQQLEIPYLWIDSLCIFQDSKEDWIKESSRMCDVYGNAYLMIAAVSAKNCNEGFLGPRDQVYINIPFRSNSRSDMVLAFPIPSNEAAPLSRYVSDPIEIGDFADEPLSKRAWTLQERYLSQSKLHFTRSKVYCEFRTEIIAEGGGRYSGQYHIPANMLDKGYFQTAVEGNTQRRWIVVITQYSRRSLTVDNDKLPAIAGLAFYLSLQDPQTPRYAAGLWRNDLILGMSWRIDRKYPRAGAPRSYTAPSWSWASVNSAVHMPFFRMKELAIVSGIEIYLEDTKNPFGRVTGGWVQLSATKLQLHVAPGAQEGQSLCYEGELHCSFSVEWDSPRYDETGSCLEDYISQQLELFAVPLLLFEETGLFATPRTNWPPCFLIITPSRSGSCPIDNIPQFRRVGLGEISMVYPGDGDSYDVDVGKLFGERFLTDKNHDLLEDIIII